MRNTLLSFILYHTNEKKKLEGYLYPYMTAAG